MCFLLLNEDNSGKRPRPRRPSRSGSAVEGVGCYQELSVFYEITFENHIDESADSEITMSQETLPEQYRATGFKRVMNAFTYSMDGLGSTLKHEAAFRQEMALAALLIPLAIVLPVDLFSKALLIGTVIAVLIVELLNSAIEATIDYISTANHYLAKRAKDMGSAAVFLSLFQLFTVWALVLVHWWDPIVARVQSWIPYTT